MNNDEAYKHIENIVFKDEEKELSSLEDRKLNNEALNHIREVLKNERPQGEWIPKHLWDKTHVWVCSECGNQNIHGITVEKACWKCGADMRKPNYLKKQLVGNSDRLEKREEE